MVPSINLWTIWIDLFWVYAKLLMQINKFLSIIHKFVKVYYETIIASGNLWINYLHKLFFISSKISQSKWALICYCVCKLSQMIYKTSIKSTSIRDK